MSAPKFTRGPWRFYTEPQPNGCPIVGSNGLMVCMLAHSIHHDDQRDTAIANAALIAAAPDLLKALEEVDEVLDGQEDIDGNGGPNNAMRLLPIVRAAIAKATGETP